MTRPGYTTKGEPGALLAEAEALDARDPLAPLRAQFAQPRDAAGRELTYLCGHSLGLAPLAARQYVNEELSDWETLGVEGHHTARRPWIGYAEQLRDGMARLAGAQAGEVVAMNSLTVNLHLLLAGFYRPVGKRCRIVIEAGAFPSDRHAVVSQILWHGLDPATTLLEVAPPPGGDLIDEAQVEALLDDEGGEIALVLWPGVQYLSGQCFDLSRIAAAAARNGARCGFDLAHAIGNTTLALHDCGADFAVWCGYKYLNGGPGAIAGAFVHSRHAHSSLPRLAGWWGNDPATRFQMQPAFQPAPGAAGWQVSNPPILSAAPLLASLALFETAGPAPLQAKSIALTGWLDARLRRDFADSIDVITPAAPAARGSQLSLRFRGGNGMGRRAFDALTAHGVVADWREPDVIRVAPVPLYNRYADAARLLLHLDQVLERA